MKKLQIIENPIYALVADYMFINNNNMEKRIAQITLEHISNINIMTVERFAELCGVSVSTYLRFCKSIGYNSFTEFKVKMMDVLNKYMFSNTPYSSGEVYTSRNFFEVTRKVINEDLDTMEKCLDVKLCQTVIEKIHEAKSIYILDLFYSTIRCAFQSDLAVTGKKVYFMSPHEIDESFVNELDESCFVFINYDGCSRTLELCKLIPLCHQSGAHLTAMSVSEHFINWEYCHEVMVLGRANTAISSIMLHDLLFQYLSTLYREKYIAGKNIMKEK